MRIHIVHGSTGEYEDYQEWIAGVFGTLEMALSFKTACEAQAIYMQELMPSTFGRDPEDFYDEENNNFYPRYFTEHLSEDSVDQLACYDYTGTSYFVSTHTISEEF